MGGRQRVTSPYRPYIETFDEEYFSAAGCNYKCFRDPQVSSLKKLVLFSIFAG